MSFYNAIFSGVFLTAGVATVCAVAGLPLLAIGAVVGGSVATAIAVMDAIGAPPPPPKPRTVHHYHVVDKCGTYQHTTCTVDPNSPAVLWDMVYDIFCTPPKPKAACNIHVDCTPATVVVTATGSVHVDVDNVTCTI